MAGALPNTPHQYGAISETICSSCMMRGAGCDMCMSHELPSLPIVPATINNAVGFSTTAPPQAVFHVAMPEDGATMLAPRLNAVLSGLDTENFYHTGATEVVMVDHDPHIMTAMGRNGTVVEAHPYSFPQPWRQSRTEDFVTTPFTYSHDEAEAAIHQEHDIPSNQSLQAMQYTTTYHPATSYYRPLDSLNTRTTIRNDSFIEHAFPVHKRSNTTEPIKTGLQEPVIGHSEPATTETHRRPISTHGSQSQLLRRSQNMKANRYGDQGEHLMADSPIYVSTSAKALVSTDGHFVIHLFDGTPIPAIRHEELYPEHQSHDYTTLGPEPEQICQQFWKSERGPARPQILYAYADRQEVDQQSVRAMRTTRELSLRPLFDSKGRIVVNSSGKALRASPFLPLTVASTIEGWHMEAIMRHDRSVTVQDFIDRMPANSTIVKSKHRLQALATRRSKDRQKYRITAWPQPKKPCYADRKVWEEMDDEARAANSTQSLEDLTVDEISVQEAIIYGNMPHEGSKRDRMRQICKIKSSLKIVRGSGYAEDSEEVETLKTKLAAWEAFLPRRQVTGQIRAHGSSEIS